MTTAVRPRYFSPVQRIADFFSRIMQRWLPDAYLFALILTFVVFLAGMVFEQQSPMAMVQYWGDSLWNLLAFSMQMLLILVTGHVLAQSPPIHRVLVRIACLPRNPTEAIMLVTLCSGVASWINWGFGLVAGALIARETGKRVSGVHYPLLVAAAYSSFILWHAGISGSIPLVIASPGTDVLGNLLGGQAIGFGETVFSLPVLLIVFILLLSLPALNALMQPDSGRVLPYQAPDIAPATNDRPTTPAQQLEHSRIVAFAFGTLGAVYLADYFASGGTITFNIVIMLFLVSGILLHGSAASYLSALAEAIKGVGGIVLQYPLYAGIMGMMQASGLAASISNWFVEVATAETFSVYTFFSAGIVNFFVPSGGGQWAIQGPIVIPAAEALGVDRGRAVMAVAFGDAWTNLIQPFWALPMLAIAGLKIRDIMGYCTVALFWSGLVISAGFLLLY
jgi:short-chain fatty acids transporter